MITITQNKVDGFEPRWAGFHGFSILFDNPEKTLAPYKAGLSRIACLPEHTAQLVFYHKLDEALGKLGRDTLIQTFLFCPLPFEAYHVTVWDGINDNNASSVTSALREDWGTFLAGLPASLKTPPASMATVTNSDLMALPPFSIQFEFEKLSLWGNQVLVARLRPANSTSEGVLGNIMKKRELLCSAASKALGVSPSKSYSPHVSLGYFANQEHGLLATSHLEKWTTIFSKCLGDTSVIFTSLDIYGFTDMVTFFK